MRDMEAVRSAFGKRFGGAPTTVVRAPGRVDLLGEELGAHGLPSLSLTLDRGVRLAFRPRDDGEVRVLDLRPGGGELSFEVGVALDAPDGLEGALKSPARALARRHAVWRGFDAVVAYDLPAGSAQALRAAVGAAVAAALVEVGEVGLDRAELAALLGREVGDEAGHRLCLEARPDHAVALSGEPARIRHLLLPEDWRVVVAPGGTRHAAEGGAPPWRAQRRAECGEALERLGAEMEARGRARRAPASWRALFRAAGGADQALLLGEEVLDGPLLKRFRHLATETERVRAGEDALLLADIHGLGDHMDACHASLRRDYLVSSAAADAVAASALEGGAAGAHLTGEGCWVVALADAGTVDGVLEALRDQAARSRADGEPFVARVAGGTTLEPF